MMIERWKPGGAKPVRLRKDGEPHRPHRPTRRQKLTEFLINSLKLDADGRGCFVHDTQQKGLLVQLHRSKSKKFKTTYTYRGKTRWMSIGDCTAITLAQARAITNDVMYKVAKGEDPASDRKVQKGLITFKQLHQRYLNEHAKKKNKSWPQANKLVERYLLDPWGELAAASITRDQARRIANGIDAPILKNQLLAAASAVFSWGIRQDVLLLNPVKGVDRSYTNERERTLNNDELPLFWEAFGEEGPVGVALKLVLLTGARPGEVANFKRRHLSDGHWCLPGKPEGDWPGTKNGHSLDIWLSGTVRQLIDQYEPVKRSEMGRAMRNISKRLSLAHNPVKPHDLRRTFGTRCTGIGFSREEMDRLLNHFKKSVGRIYDRTKYREPNARIWEAVNSHILEMVGEKAPDGNVVQFQLVGVNK
jgi:integrase